MKKTKLLLISLLLTDFVMLLQPENAWAGDVQITCDLRVLELTSQQRNQIRLRRQQYKTRMLRINNCRYAIFSVNQHLITSKPMKSPNNVTPMMCAKQLPS